MRTVLTIGREPDNDLVINLPIVSAHHARVTWEGVPGQGLIEDLGSSNGTAVGQMDRKITRSILTPSDLVYLGNHPVPGSELLAWVDPSLAPGLLFQGDEMVIGREPGCQRVIDRSTISGRHARFRRVGERILIEDLGSSNGTFVNGLPVQGATEVRAGDLIGLGGESFRLTTSPARATVAGTQKLDAISPSNVRRPAPTIAVRADSTSPGVPKFAAWVHPVALLAVLLQAPVLAALIGILAGDNGSANPGIARSLFVLCLAAAWCGLATALVGLGLDPDRAAKGVAGSADQGRFWLSRLALLGGLCVGEGVLAQIVAYPLAGLQGSGATALVILVLTSGVGLALGCLIVEVTPGPIIAGSALVAVVLALGLFGGGPWSLSRSVPVVRIVSDASPTRWAFEGLLEAEALARRSGSTEPGGEHDLAAEELPEGVRRMGPRAATLALGSMLIGLVGLGAFVVRSSGAYQ